MSTAADGARRYIGLMSGTSMDGVDGALVTFSAAGASTLAFASRDMPAPLRRVLADLQSSGPDEIARAALAANALADLYADLALELLERGAAFDPDTAADVVIGAHGQTVRHRPELGYTVQLLNGARLAERSGLTVVCDFRSADVAASGQGAPLVPAYHADAFGREGVRRALVNVGGIANISVLAPGAATIGYDTGPGNVLMDEWCQHHRQQPFDRDGAWAASGTVHAGLLAALLDEPYFARPTPKSTGRDLFNAAWLAQRLSLLAHAPGPGDVQATLAELTAVTIARACAAGDCREVFVCGGGARNAHLMRRLEALCRPAVVDTTAALGVPPQAVEAVAFAWLARQRMLGLPGNLPAVTGAEGPRVLGAVYPAPPAAGG
ncbi:MAG TPA: anhydro-N-acetylmuramic acid kinase [Quisquiliibacterium sp.]|nr:anhydro-N-acetylmuramic acid kinase [Quisquiliibacterium sp.]